MASFALTGDMLIILAMDRMFKVKLAETVMYSGSFVLPE